MENKAVSNTGPIIHLTEISFIDALEIFSSIFTSKEVIDELLKYKIGLPKKVKLKNLSHSSKDMVKLFTNKYNLDIGESSAIALALQEKINYFITDDLDARIVAKDYSLEVHGTIGIVLRAFRQKIIDKKTTINKINELYNQSSLFITKDLVNNVLKAVEEFR
ncbi:MAG: DUF3368 domain-containing protein [Nanoarchaeota archaeon]